MSDKIKTVVDEYEVPFGDDTDPPPPDLGDDVHAWHGFLLANDFGDIEERLAALSEQELYCSGYNQGVYDQAQRHPVFENVEITKGDEPVTDLQDEVVAILKEMGSPRSGLHFSRRYASNLAAAALSGALPEADTAPDRGRAAYELHLLSGGMKDMVTCRAAVDSFLDSKPNYNSALSKPHLLDRINGVAGDYAVVRVHKSGYTHYWHTGLGGWMNTWDDVLTKEYAEALRDRIISAGDY